MTIAKQLGVQAIGAAAVLAWSGFFTFLIIKASGALTGGLRVSEDDEQTGLDIAAHAERGYHL